MHCLVSMPNSNVAGEEDIKGIQLRQVIEDYGNQILLGSCAITVSHRLR